MRWDKIRRGKLTGPSIRTEWWAFVNDAELPECVYFVHGADNIGWTVEHHFDSRITYGPYPTLEDAQTAAELLSGMEV